MNLDVEVKTNWKNHQSVSDSIESGHGPVRDVLTSFERTYRAFVLKRFDKFSRGGGDWKPLSLWTILWKLSTKILVDTRAMRMALPTAVRSVAFTRNSVIFGFVSDTIHPVSNLPIAEMLSIHHEGRGVVPARPILVVPDQETKAKILKQATKEMAAAMNGD